VLFAAAAAADSDDEGDSGIDLGAGVARKNPAQMASQRAQAERRRRVHFKCDNSAKV
jgi:hypothetical protein